MGLLAFIKDKVGDAFGIYDDVQDFKNFVTRVEKELSRKTAVVTKVVESLDRELLSAASAEDLDGDKPAQLKAVLEDIKKDVTDLSRETQKVSRLADKDQAVSSQLRGMVRQAEQATSTFLRELDKARDYLKAVEAEQRALFAKIQDSEDVQAARRKMGATVGRLAGAAAAVAAAGVLIKNLLRVM